MSSLLGSGSGLAGLARVAFETTGVGETTRDIERVSTTYRRESNEMSDAAIKVALAQDRLERSLRRGPTAWRQQASAELQVRRARRELAAETDGLTRSHDRQRNAMVGLRRSIVGLAASYIGAQGIISLARSSANAAREEELVLGQTRVAVEALGIQYDRYRGQIEAVIQSTSQLGFDDEELAKSFQLLVRSTRDVDKALGQLGLAADVARGRYIDLEAATQIVNKANLGMSGALRRIGIDVDKNAKSTELLARLNQSYGRSAEEAANTGVAAADRFSVATENFQEAIGRGLTPALIELSERATKYLSNAENQRRVQEQVTEVMRHAETAVRGFAGGLKLARDVTAPFVSALGGVENTVRVLTALWIAHKVKAIAGFTATAASSRATATKMIADATAAGRAWDIATRPRVLSVTTTATGVGSRGRVPAPTPTPAPRRGGGGLVGTAVVIGAALLGPDLVGRIPEGALIDQFGGGTGLSAREKEVIRRRVRRGYIGRAMLEEARAFLGEAFYRELLQLIREREAERQPGGDREGRTAGRPTRDTRNLPDPPPTPPRRFTFGSFTRQIAGLDEDALDADATERTDDNLRVERARLALAQRALRELKLTAAQRLQVKQERNRALAAIAAIEQAEEQETARINEERARKQAEAKRRAQERLDRILDQAEKVAERRGELLRGTGGSRANMRRRALAGVDEVVAGVKSKAQKEADAARELQRQVRSSQFEFLSMFQGTMNQLGGNLFGAGQLQVAGGSDPRLYTELKSQTYVLSQLARGVTQPGTRYAGTEIAHLFDGPTF